MPFADVAQDAWYAGAVAWAGENGIVNGVGGGVFAPGKAITREQMVTMLYRYACYRGEATGAAGDLKQFADGEEVSAWAVEAMSWAVGAGLISGVAPPDPCPRRHRYPRPDGGHPDGVHRDDEITGGWPGAVHWAPGHPLTGERR